MTTTLRFVYPWPDDMVPAMPVGRVLPFMKPGHDPRRLRDEDRIGTVTWIEPDGTITVELDDHWVDFVVNTFGLSL